MVFRMESWTSSTILTTAGAMPVGTVVVVVDEVVDEVVVVVVVGADEDEDGGGGGGGGSMPVRVWVTGMTCVLTKSVSALDCLMSWLSTHMNFVRCSLLDGETGEW